jgi:hypothetical protein
MYDPIGAVAEAVTVKDNVDPLTPDNVEVGEGGAQDGYCPFDVVSTRTGVTAQVIVRLSLNPPEDVVSTVMVELGLNGSVVDVYPCVTSTGVGAGGVPDSGLNATL